MEKIYINTLRIAKKKVIRYALQKKKKKINYASGSY